VITAFAIRTLAKLASSVGASLGASDRRYGASPGSARPISAQGNGTSGRIQLPQVLVRKCIVSRACSSSGTLGTQLLSSPPSGAVVRSAVAASSSPGVSSARLISTRNGTTEARSGWPPGCVPSSALTRRHLSAAPRPLSPGSPLRPALQTGRPARRSSLSDASRPALGRPVRWPGRVRSAAARGGSPARSAWR